MMGLHARDIGAGLASSFCQPIGQGLPQDMLALLVAIDRQHRGSETAASGPAADAERDREDDR